MASLRSKGEAQVPDLPETITKPVARVVRESEGGWGEKAGKVGHQISKEILPGAEEGRKEVRAPIVASKRVTTVEPRGVGR